MQVLTKTTLLTYCCAIAHFKPPSADDRLAPTVCRQKSPVRKSFWGSITHTAGKKSWPCARRRRQKYFHFTTDWRSQCYDGLDMLSKLNLMICAVTTVVVQCHLHVTIHRNSSTHKAHSWQNSCTTKDVHSSNLAINKTTVSSKNIHFSEGDHTHFKRYIHPFNGPLSGTIPAWASTRKVKPIWILLKQETVSGSGISWAICKSAPCSRQITMPAAPPLSFLQAGCPSCHPTNSVRALKVHWWHFSGMADRFISHLCKTFSGFYVPKLFKLADFLCLIFLQLLKK